MVGKEDMVDKAGKVDKAFGAAVIGDTVGHLFVRLVVLCRETAHDICVVHLYSMHL